VRLTPDKPELHVGDELKCSARGNPSPELTFSPGSAEQSDGQLGGEAWKTMKVPADWKDQRRTVNCTAVNRLNDQTRAVVASATFNVIGQTPTSFKLYWLNAQTLRTAQ